MTVDLHQIDRITNYDEAIHALEDYVAALVDEFVASSEGMAYLTAHPEMSEYVGSWIDHLLYFSYAYRSRTLPQLTQADVEAVVSELFPQKITLLDPEEAITTIPELLAFWQFLGREYKHPNAKKIQNYLKKIQPTFKDLMNDRSKFGVAKSFVSAGMAAGYDMTSEEGLRAFQEHYNQTLQTAGANSPLDSSGQGTAMLPIDQINPSTLPPEVQQLFNTIAGAIHYQQDFDTDVDDLVSEPQSSFKQELEASIWQNTAAKLAPISDDAIALFQQQTITETSPGTIVQDFQTLLDFVGDGVPVSSTNHFFSQKLLADLNQRLSNPIQINLKRPVQKSYPFIHGLYLLLRTSGLGQIITRGKKYILVLNPEVLRSWQQLNPTERYFTLLEAWMIRGSDEVLGEKRSVLSEGTKCTQAWGMFPKQGQTFKGYNEQELLNYHPGYHNLALMHLFGFLQVESGKPGAGKGWRVKKVKPLPFGDAMIKTIVNAFIEHGMEWESETNPTIPFAELQPTLQPYFPEWQKTLSMPQPEFRSGVHIFKVSLRDMWRRIAISGDMTLFDLSQSILQSIDFDSDHLDMFVYKNQVGRTIEIAHPYADRLLSTDEVRVGDLPLAEGACMTYIFDFGDWWEFNVQLETVQTQELPSSYAAIVDRHGDAPPQYPDWDE